MHRPTRLLAVALLVIGVSSAATSAAGAATGGKVWVWGKPGNGAVSTIMFTGAIGDHGTATSINKDGKVDENGDYVRVKLSKGSFEINAVELNKKTDSTPPNVNKATCSFSFIGSGTVTLFNGTGSYAGISGTLQVTLAYAGVGPLYKTGAKKGQCNTSNSAAPVAAWSGIIGKGSIKFA